MTHRDNGQTPSDLLQTADILRRERPEPSAVRLDEIKRDVLTRSTRSRQPRIVTSLRRKLMALTLFVLLFSLSTSSAAASLLNWVSGGSFGSNTLGYGNQSGGVKFFFGSFGVGGDSSDDAGKETYCPDDKGSDDSDGSSGDDSDGDKSSYSKYGGGGDGSDDSDRSSGDQSDRSEGECESDEKSSEKSDDSDKSSDDNSDEKSDDNDKSSDDNSDRDTKSDDNDKSSGDYSDEKSDDNDKSSDDQSD